MRRLKGKRVFFIVLFMAIFIIGYKASAEDTLNKGSLEITHLYKDEPLANVKFSIYKVANFNENVGLQVSDYLKKYPINFDSLKDKSDWYLLYDTLGSYVKVDNIPHLREGKTDFRGKLKFADLELGIYLVVGETLIRDSFKYEVKPFLVGIPSKSDGKVLYDIKAYTKIERLPIGAPGVFVQKKWVNDKKENRPKSIKVSLYKNNSLYDSAILDEENNWQYRWDNLEDSVDWSVVEEDVPFGYSVSYEKYGGAIIVTNSGSGASGVFDSIPQTGDSLLKLTLINILAILCIVIGYFLRKSKKT